MEISKAALLLVIKAARTSMRMAETMHGLMAEKHQWTMADIIAGDLKEALFDILGEEATLGSDFNESMTMRLLTGDMPDGAVADWIIMMQNIRAKHLQTEQPKPNTFSKDETKEMFRKNGGYMVEEAERPE